MLNAAKTPKAGVPVTARKRSCMKVMFSQVSGWGIASNESWDGSYSSITPPPQERSGGVLSSHGDLFKLTHLDTYHPPQHLVMKTETGEHMASNFQAYIFNWNVLCEDKATSIGQKFGPKSN